MKIALLTTDNRQPFRQFDRPEPFFGTAPEALLQGFAALPEAEVHVVACIRRPVNSPEKLAPNIFFHSVVVPKIGWMRTLYQGCVRATRKKLREIQPDIVHGQGTELDCGISAAFSGFPNVLTIHGNMRLIAKVNQARPFSFNWMAARLEDFTLPRTDGIVAITNYTRTAVASRARHTWVLPNAVDESFFSVQAAPDLTAPPIGLCVGTICHRKNQNHFIRALDSLAKERKFKIIFLGLTDHSAYSREFLELIRERPWCEHAGFADRTNLKTYFQSATLVVLPTLEDNCPMVVLEAMAAGVPVLASNVGGVPDLIEPEVTGLFCHPDQPESFRTGITRLLDDRPLAQQLATNAKTAALQRFHPQAVARQHLKIYQEVLTMTGSRAGI
ncbi:MAG: glycosyltransferase family 4 protein [Verrucomicrobiota bacterium]